MRPNATQNNAAAQRRHDFCALPRTEAANLADPNRWNGTSAWTWTAQPVLATSAAARHLMLELGARTDAENPWRPANRAELNRRNGTRIRVRLRNTRAAETKLPIFFLRTNSLWTWHNTPSSNA